MIRSILHYPDARLREVGARVETFDAAFRELVDDMAETMYAAPGIGLAATQIGVALQLFVVDVASDDEPSDLRVFANPEFLEREGELKFQEGCLSFPGASENVERAAKVRVRAQDRNGKTFEIEAEGLLAVALQHEYDHLQGVLMIDHLGPLKKRVLHRKMQKRASDHASV